MKEWRRGHTTGTCAAGAVKGALAMLVHGEILEEVQVDTPAGITLALPLIEPRWSEEEASCGILKDGGDDPDVTHGLIVYAQVRWRSEEGFSLKAGPGVGTATKGGLAVSVGEPAINPVPRQMIAEAVHAFLPPGRGVEIMITVPGGEEVARRTLNPQLGILGGISILGTSGIVEPMSEEAFKDSLIPQIDVALAAGQRSLVLTPGRTGQKKAWEMGAPEEGVLQMSNFVGHMLDGCAARGVREVLLFGHVGKLIKVAGGIFHTHSKVSDGRREILISHLALAGAPREFLSEVWKANTAEEGVQRILLSPYRDVLQEIAREVSRRAGRRLGPGSRVGVVMTNLAGTPTIWEEQAVAMGKEWGWCLTEPN